MCGTFVSKKEYDNFYFSKKKLWYSLESPYRGKFTYYMLLCNNKVLTTFQSNTQMNRLEQMV